MKQLDDTLVTPIYVKTAIDMPWPDDKVFYLLTADGLFLCRNHPFFRSSVAAPRWPSELRWHNPLFRATYPKLARQQIEQVVGFFATVGEDHRAEAIAILAWDSEKQQIEVIVPEQVATVGCNRWGDTWPIGVEYDAPSDLPANLVIIGDIHSHVDGAAYASYTDKDDEAHRPGLHVVVGRIHHEPPDIHVQAVVDGSRFDLAPHQVMESYHRRSYKFPELWLDKVKIETRGSGQSRSAATYTSHSARSTGITSSSRASPTNGSGDGRTGSMKSSDDTETLGQQAASRSRDRSPDDTQLLPIENADQGSAEPPPAKQIATDPALEPESQKPSNEQNIIPGSGNGQTDTDTTRASEEPRP